MPFESAHSVGAEPSMIVKFRTPFFAMVALAAAVSAALLTFSSLGGRTLFSTHGAVGGGAADNSFASGPDLYLSPSGSDAGSCGQAAPCLSFARAYQLASPGAT